MYSLNTALAGNTQHLPAMMQGVVKRVHTPSGYRQCASNDIYCTYRTWNEEETTTTQVPSSGPPAAGWVPAPASLEAVGTGAWDIHREQMQDRDLFGKAHLNSQAAPSLEHVRLLLGLLVDRRIMLKSSQFSLVHPRC